MSGRTLCWSKRRRGDSRNIHRTIRSNLKGLRKAMIPCWVHIRVVVDAWCCVSPCVTQSQDTRVEGYLVEHQRLSTRQHNLRMWVDERASRCQNIWNDFVARHDITQYEVSTSIAGNNWVYSTITTITKLTAAHVAGRH